ncbi:MAG: BlaI/MecI/CopY family transcriptional regulator [Acidobacteria bacterium]|nr:BlaI/MecI/CopY family transcriptional regulator [Acidobacteriota bacterium]
MSRKRSATLTDAELKLMRVLWQLGPSTVGAVVGALRGRRAPAYNTVLTVMRILETKGYVKHRKEGRAFVFEPLVDETHARKSVLRYMLDRFFDNSPGALVLSLLEHEAVPDAEMQQLREMIQQHEAR